MALTIEELKWATILALTEPPQRFKHKEEPVSISPFFCLESLDKSAFRVSLEGMVSNIAKAWDNIMEYSTDGVLWVLWPKGEYVYAEDGVFYLRGTGNTQISNNYITKPYYKRQFRIDSYPEPGYPDIKVSGSLDALIDYETVMRGDRVSAASLNNYCFSNLFDSCLWLRDVSQLTFNLWPSQACWSEMFVGCSELEKPPNLSHIESTAWRCFNHAFRGCTRLDTLPRLTAKVLETSCYQYMFYDCSAIKLSAEQGGEYQYPYRIPMYENGELAPGGGAMTAQMFEGTGGSYTGPVNINTTYYTDHEPV